MRIRAEHLSSDSAGLFISDLLQFLNISHSVFTGMTGMTGMTGTEDHNTTETK